MLADPAHSAAIRQGLLNGFSVLPAWMQSLVRELPGCDPQVALTGAPWLATARRSPSLDQTRRDRPLNPAFNTVITASDDERRGLFLATAARLGTAVQNVEKDFWVCWTLDALFNGLPTSGPRLLFKGGTSLSKAFGLIHRFSEDIDITVFRDDLGQATDVADLDALSGKKRRARLDAIRSACQAYIAGPQMEQFAGVAASVIRKARFRLELDPEDKDGLAPLPRHPPAIAGDVSPRVASQPRLGDRLRSTREAVLRQHGFGTGHRKRLVRSR